VQNYALMYQYRNMPISAEIIRSISQIARMGEESIIKKVAVDNAAEFHFVEFSVRDIGKRDLSPYVTLGFFEKNGGIVIEWHTCRLHGIQQDTVPVALLALRSTGEQVLATEPCEKGIDIGVFESMDQWAILTAIKTVFQRYACKYQKAAMAEAV
jgi:hypothetical protein